MPHRRIRANYEQLSEFEIDPIIRLREGGWANRRIAGHMGRRDAAIRRYWQEWVHNGRFQRHDARATNPASICALMIIKDVSGDGKGSVPIMLSLLHATEALNNELCLSNTSLASQIARSLFNRACLGYDAKATASTRECLMTWPDNWSTFGKKYHRRPPGYFITLCHVVWQLASRLEVGQHLIELATL
ncbi:HTH_Tnp_Tc3_2 domain-containing protein [Trichonephila clavipes]|uniref:HTH_Tnp_Tc3_2 domain-containing protein n=1 Tax=Trichonephila clavipes TaxID=2585209 RepID=A0A8X6RH55_TRICX|nr:HTH_Tnp_Tc3_2 domain-containing protein [Trichonephila clavipes]